MNRTRASYTGRFYTVTVDDDAEVWVTHTANPSQSASFQFGSPALAESIFAMIVRYDLSRWVESEPWKA